MMRKIIGRFDIVLPQTQNRASKEAPPKVKAVSLEQYLAGR